jgi:2-keto-4-pentenoate hydratase
MMFTGDTMTDDPTTALVHALVQARNEQTTIAAAPWAATLSRVDQAYAVQDGVARRLGWFDTAPPRHWKSGGPSRDTPLTHAPLPPAGVWASPADASAWPFHLRGIEAEVALRLAVDVDAAQAAALDESKLAGLVDAMAVAIELIDSRWSEGTGAPPLLRLADQGVHGALVLGAWVPYAAKDWSTQPCRLLIGSRPPLERHGTHPLGDPAWLLPQWLRHATRHGGTVRAGTVVTTGAWIVVPDGQAGEKVTAEFDGIGSATVQL